METNLRNKVAVVTGAGGVICSVMAKSLAAMGVKTALIDINADAVEKLAQEIETKYNVSSIGLAASVLDKESLQEAKRIINNKLGSVDYLINGAGGNSPLATSGVDQMVDSDLENLEETFFGMKMEGFDRVFDLNFKGTILPTMVFAMDMIEKKGGSIVNVSSMNSYRPLTRIAAYSAAKASVNNFTQWLAVHFSKMGVRVNAIAPGFLLTNQNRFLLTDEATGEPTARGVKIINNTPMERYGTPEELQGTLLYLLSDWSAFVTGIVIPVDGGFSAYSGV
ncbi:SDR family oxidoreductase [Labilibaculum euxinus]|uniref:SDR family oxidoreductase n=1 Tax=Labilibaculum euxinus TaxID=2686357 RepID=A0A7M4D3S9_9BACT|nr:SDR family oxidoreductase [Labilibaculum euxinus]MUP37308.1 SDR family oxidoreductase [Labilibaculum euxinus]MVB06513.1 SDR family oxidoreductase [Labilibaculum euxinus]